MSSDYMKNVTNVSRKLTLNFWT